MADTQQRKLWGVLSAEIGGGNGLEPLAIGARMSLPVVDADYMGRAFPELQVAACLIVAILDSSCAVLKHGHIVNKKYLRVASDLAKVSGTK